MWASHGGGTWEPDNLAAPTTTKKALTTTSRGGGIRHHQGVQAHELLSRPIPPSQRPPQPHDAAPQHLLEHDAVLRAAHRLQKEHALRRQQSRYQLSLPGLELAPVPQVADGLSERAQDANARLHVLRRAGIQGASDHVHHVAQADAPRHVGGVQAYRGANPLLAQGQQHRSITRRRVVLHV